MITQSWKRLACLHGMAKLQQWLPACGLRSDGRRWTSLALPGVSKLLGWPAGRYVGMTTMTFFFLPLTQVLGQLGDSSRLTRALQTRHQDHRGGVTPGSATAFAHSASSSGLDDLDDTGRRTGAGDFWPTARFAT